MKSYLVSVLDRCVEQPTEIIRRQPQFLKKLEQAYGVELVRLRDGGIYDAATVARQADSAVLRLLEDVLISGSRELRLQANVCTRSPRFAAATTDNGRICSVLQDLFKQLGPVSTTAMRQSFSQAAAPKPGDTVLTWLECVWLAADKYNFPESEVMTHILTSLATMDSLWCSRGEPRGTYVSPPGAMYDQLAKEYDGKDLTEIVRLCRADRPGAQCNGPLQPPVDGGVKRHDSALPEHRG